MVKKKKATGRGRRFAKSRARPLRAEVPCNYIHGRLAAALQSVFEISGHSLPPFFQCLFFIFLVYLQFDNYYHIDIYERFC